MAMNGYARLARFPEIEPRHQYILLTRTTSFVGCLSPLQRWYIQRILSLTNKREIKIYSDYQVCYRYHDAHRGLHEKLRFSVTVADKKKYSDLIDFRFSVSDSSFLRVLCNLPFIKSIACLPVNNLYFLLSVVDSIASKSSLEKDLLYLLWLFASCSSVRK